jgi:hypothetical protein
MNATTRNRRPSGYSAYTNGSNALKVGSQRFGWADESEIRGTRIDDGSARVGWADPVEAPPAAPDRRRARRRRAPWVTDVTTESGAAPAPQVPPLPIALPRAPFLTLMVGLVVVGVLGVLVLNTKINENSFRLNDLRATQAALDLQQQQLERDLANLESPGNLRAAATRLGLVPAGTPAFISLPDGRVVGVPQPASGR